MEQVFREQKIKSLNELMDGVSFSLLQGSADAEIRGVAYDSRKVEPGWLFVCMRGMLVDGHRFAASAAEKGAAALIVEEPVDVPEGVAVLQVENARLALALVSANWFDHPADKLKTIGITGTKGKTTTAYMVQSILEAAGHKTGLIGTIETITGNRRIKSENTTPESYLVQEYFAEMVESGCDCVVMEVSSQALMMDRVAGILFDFGIFTNIEADHIGPNEHASFSEYLECKKKMLQICRVGIVNCDDKRFDRIVEGCTCTLETFGYSENATLRARNAMMLMKPGYLG
ncbi:MAG: UDP-N-acetylmuramoyl-L-alanyl-D-glutamate--2,6-diaminopimelate ligase, partial [Eubacterium sp.]|nr:UDP-N-acetylmuramoyl-L-alanyl-D-glutamate--2,6-diaminopimelate ligase [Eubacterium sp.]